MKIGTGNNFSIQKWSPVIYTVDARRPNLVNFVAKRQPSKSGDFYSCIKPLYKVCRVFGLLPFIVLDSSNGRYGKARVGVFDVIWSAVSIIIQIVLMYIIVPSIRPSNEFGSSVLYSGGRLALFFCYILSLLSIVFDIINRKRIAKIFQDFSTFDKEVSNPFT